MENELCEKCHKRAEQYYSVPEVLPWLHCHHDDPVPKQKEDREDEMEFERVNGYAYKGPHGLWLLDTEEVEEYASTLKKATLIVWKEK